MKQKKHNRNLRVHYTNAPSYPNAADTGYFTQKMLNVVTGIVSGMGLITAMLFLITMT